MTAASEQTLEQTAPRLSVKQIVSVALRLLFFPLVLLVPAGTWRWPEAWALIGLYMAYALVVTLWLRKRDPALLSERANASPIQKDQKTWDKVISVVFLIFGIAMLLTPSFDLRWGWTRVPVILEAIALALHIPAFIWIGWVMKENTYLSRVVKIDKDRGHEVITTGPYSHVRHPMYSAAILLLFAFPIALGSWLALVPAAASVALLIVRTALEDKTLHRELGGYPEYAQKTRYRLFPGVW